MIVFYFGLAGVLVNLTYLAQMLRLLVGRGHIMGLLMLSLLIALNTTGAGWGHPFVLLIGYTVFVGRYLMSQSASRLRRVQPALPSLGSLGGGGKGRLRLAPSAE